jgi:hypothetical protein
MSSMGDLGRELNDIRDHPTPSKPQNDLDRLEARLKDFYAWAHGRQHDEIRNHFAENFAEAPLRDDVVDALGKGKGDEVRSELPVTPDGPAAGSGSA